jgi:predicted transcriptional regulator
MKYQLLTQRKDEDTIKATWLVPKKLIRQLKHIAADNDTNVSALAIQAIEEYIARRTGK